MLQQGLLEYIFTIGILISFVALIIGVIKDRKNIKKTLHDHNFNKKDLILVIGIVLVFVFMELYFIKPTQLLFFDDAIYQGMALDLLKTGQAWMCNYGTATTCLSGQIYHEPIGLSFNMAIAFLLFGVKRNVAYGAEFALGVVSIIMSFFASLLLLKNKKAAYFTEFLMALSPVILVWGMPTNSDLAVLAYSMICIFFFMIFVERKNVWSLSNFLFSFSLLFYMKVDEIFFIPVFIVLYLILNDKSIAKTIKETFSAIKKNILNTKLLIILLFVFIAIVPSILYSINESFTDGYGYQGTIIQNTCTKNLTPLSVNASIGLQNFNANICGNILFWFNNYKSAYVMQPIIFTILAFVGIAFMLVYKKRTLASIAIWFMVFFLLYAAFYAGSVMYGVDWRFMLSLIAQVSMMGGFGVAMVLEEIERYAKRFKDKAKFINGIALVAMIVLIIYPIYTLLPLLSVNPSSIQQAGDARFYENFVYNTSKTIPSNCIVYTYDPTLFNINNRTATQMDNVYNSTQVNQYRSEYSCLVLDYGYWCHTPNNECTSVNQTYQLVPIATATYNAFNYNYGFYYIRNLSSSNSTN
ncbi:MAG: glycosyltransferase family 39 protein [Candidatus Micrarchaeaceae archaeon]|jgi:hypothetical protein